MTRFFKLVLIEVAMLLTAAGVLLAWFDMIEPKGLRPY